MKLNRFNLWFGHCKSLQLKENMTQLFLLCLVPIVILQRDFGLHTNTVAGN